MLGTGTTGVAATSTIASPETSKYTTIHVKTNFKISNL